MILFYNKKLKQAKFKNKFILIKINKNNLTKNNLIFFKYNYLKVRHMM